MINKPCFIGKFGNVSKEVQCGMINAVRRYFTVERSTRKGVISLLLSEGLMVLVHFPGLELGEFFWEGYKVLRTGLGVQC